MFVNSKTGSFYIGDSTNSPVEVLTVNSGPIDVRNVETFCGLTLDEIFAKAKEEGIGGGGSAHDWPSKADLTLGNTVVWAGENWLVCHTTETEAYLILTYAYSQCNFDSLQSQCNSFRDSKFTQDQLAVLKPITPPDRGATGNGSHQNDMYSTTSGKVFVPSRPQFNGAYSDGFSYFTGNSQRSINAEYWTCSFDPSDGDSQRTAYRIAIHENGSFNDSAYSNSSSHVQLGFRPAICVDLTLYD